MKRGFTILELMVASLLLALLVSVLTMLFNQSSISWRTGIASVADLDEARNNIAEVVDEADNIYIWNNQIHRLVGLWDDDAGTLRKRAWDVGDGADAPHADFLKKELGNNPSFKNIKEVSVGRGESGKSFTTYVINVKSAGPNRIFGDDSGDDIWSYPDDIQIN